MDGEISHADGWADAPPIFFLKHQKENAPRPVEKKKCSAGRSAPAQTSCRRRGMVGCPLRQSGTETRCPWGNLWPGEVGDTLSDSPRCRSRFFEEQPAAAKREAAQCVNHPDALRTIRHGTAVSTSQKTQACPEASPNRRLHRYADPRTATLHACAKLRPKRLFLLHRARRVLFLGKTKKRMGGASASHPHGCFPGQWAST